MRSKAPAGKSIALEKLNSPVVVWDSDIFDPRKRLAGFETRQQAKTRRADLIRALNAGDNPSRELAEVLAACSTGARCGISICPFCMRRCRARFLIPKICAWIARWQDSTGLRGVAISAVPAELKLDSGELHNLDLAKMLDSFRQQLRRAGYGDGIAVAGVDLSFNEHSEGLWTPHWQPHFYGIVLTANSTKQVKADLEKYFASDESVRVPIKVNRLKHPMRAVSYLWKPFFQRRISYVAPNGRQAARKLPLRPKQLREVASYFADKAPTERLLFIGIRRRGQELVKA
ncbi:hypothetical protein [Ferrovibrio sp.]|uniref:hypothetical protein n=1 Tax=Ferrovibrio sp. TaxID=1917215 RepID=UPI0035B18CFD